MSSVWALAISVGLSSLAWMVVRWRESTVYQRISEQALKSCPAAQRPQVLKALAEIAGRLNSERPSIVAKAIPRPKNKQTNQ